jgi:hypothetical protein
MAEITTSWLVGSFTLAANATLVVNGNNRTVNAGTYYLRDATNALSLIFEIQTEIAAVVPGSTVSICKDRKLRIVSGGAALTLTVPATLQAVLGLPGSPSVGTTVTADSISTLLWSPGWPEATNGHPVDSDGVDIHDRIMTSSPSGQTVTVTRHHSQTIASWSWTAVPAARAWTSAEAAGEFVQFFDDVLIPGYRFKLYRNITEDSASTTAVTWVTSYGPYVMRDPDYQWYRRFNPASDDVGANIDLQGLKTSEIA